MQDENSEIVNFRNLREQAALTLAQLSELSGYSAAAINGLELKGEGSSRLKEKILSILLQKIESPYPENVIEEDDNTTLKIDPADRRMAGYKEMKQRFDKSNLHDKNARSIYLESMIANLLSDLSDEAFFEIVGIVNDEQSWKIIFELVAKEGHKRWTESHKK